MSDTIFTLFSSNHTLQYEKDIFSVLSLPRKSKFQFRYEKDYVMDSVKTYFSNAKSISNNRALVAFRSAAEIAAPNTFIIPIRWVRIKSIESITNGGWIVNFITEGYPKFSSDFSSKCAGLKDLSNCAEQIFETFNRRDLAVIDHALNLVEIEEDKSTEDRDKENWYDIIKYIARLPKYSKMHFLKCSNFYTVQQENYSSKRILNRTKDYNIEMIENQPTYIEVEYRSIEYTRDLYSELQVFVNEKILNKTNGLKTSLDSRYGTKIIGFQPQSVPDNTYTEVVISTNPDFNTQESIYTELSFPIIVRKNKKYRALKAGVMALGALFVALPGIIDQNLGLSWNIMFGAIGVTILGIGSYWESNE